MSLYFEDLDTGDAFEAGTVALSKAELVAFAEQFDPQPFHVDEEAAKDSVFGGLVASGLHTLCLSFRLFATDFVQEEGLANMGGLGLDDVRWPAPVRPGDELAVTVTVADTRPSGSRNDRGYVDFDVRAATDDGEVLSLVAHNIVRRRGDDA